MLEPRTDPSTLLRTYSTAQKLSKFHEICLLRQLCQTWQVGLRIAGIHISKTAEPSGIREYLIAMRKMLGTQKRNARKTRNTERSDNLSSRAGDSKMPSRGFWQKYTSSIDKYAIYLHLQNNTYGYNLLMYNQSASDLLDGWRTLRFIGRVEFSGFDELGTRRYETQQKARSLENVHAPKMYTRPSGRKAWNTST